MRDLAAVPKPQRIRSKALTQSAEGTHCTLRWNCHGAPDAVFCHVRAPGDGVATKPPDFWGYRGCWQCHAAEEAGRVPVAEIMRAIRETQTAMVLEGLIQIKGLKL